MVKVSVIISYYKALDNLKLILKALNNQSAKEFEAIISEDDNNPETSLFLQKNKGLYNFPIKHTCQQQDIGFRKNQMLNKSIKVAEGKTIVFIDGDCIPHKHFVKAYIDQTIPNVMLKGRRVMLDEVTTNKIKNTNSLRYLALFNILTSKSGKKKEAIYLKNKSLIFTLKDKGLLGCNWGIQKQHLLAINGFDEDYIRAAVGEDTDIEWRLKKNGIGSKSMKNKAIVYHLYHKKGYSAEGVEKNRELLREKQEANNFVCLNGLDTLSKS
ncbi:glycosyltransferase [Croceivirga sp. JEA036]|uniref:glycosyltransferase n=1 Tax=Croceivirga sp. JEA036 TaxID=2721162 RepID=UPI00143B0935|nr:glycosyltransferase [Croceivirga sp. JEA036]NJB37534.1 glycosyltransferase [Croceivirga sp. JEA036]